MAAEPFSELCVGEGEGEADCSPGDSAEVGDGVEGSAMSSITIVRATWRGHSLTVIVAAAAAARATTPTSHFRPVSPWIARRMALMSGKNPNGAIRFSSGA